jgi:hypothetical protein
MTAFRPSRPPAGRLARLGVVLDADDRAPAIARLCDRAGIDIVWLADRTAFAGGGSARGVITLAEDVAAVLERAVLGIHLVDDEADASTFDSPGLARLLGEDRLATASRLGGSGPAPADRTGPRRSIVLTDLADLPGALVVADDIVLPAWQFADLETAADEVRAEASEAGRDPSSLGVAALVPVSIGRTQAEAVARVSADPFFRLIGDPAEIGIFGTLEECQDRVIALAHAGFSDLQCIVPATLDVHDVIAQLTAITIGTSDVLIPGSLRSPSPPPPDGWGGRSPIPEQPRVSGGSRRR